MIPEGRHVVIVGRSNLVGRSRWLRSSLGRGRGGNATVTVAHSRTPDLPEVTRLGEILIVAALGAPSSSLQTWFVPGAVVIDVGVSRVEDPYYRERGYRLDWRRRL